MPGAPHASASTVCLRLSPDVDTRAQRARAAATRKRRYAHTRRGDGVQLAGEAGGLVRHAHVADAFISPLFALYFAAIFAIYFIRYERCLFAMLRQRAL